MSARSAEELLAELEAVVRDIPPEDRLELIERLTGAGEGPSTRASAADADRLRRVHGSYTQRHEFVPGQLVQWKPGLRNKPLPEYGQPAIVIEVLEEVVVNTAEPADSPYFREHLDLILGMFDRDGDLTVLHFDARRFEPAA